MEIQRLSDTVGSALRLKVIVTFDEQETQIINRYKLYQYRIKTKDGSFLGKNFVSINMQSAYRSQIGKIKNRWSAAVIRSTGSVLFDVILITLKAFYIALRSLIKLFFGRRKRLSTAMHGLTVKAKRVEKIKEAEFFILVSLAAVYRSINYIRELEQEKIKFFDDETLFAELQGLDFAGAGSAVEGEFEAINALIEKSREAA